MASGSTIGDWETWFAWKPVKVNGRWYWLRTFERRFARVTTTISLGKVTVTESYSYRFSFEPSIFQKQLKSWKQDIKNHIASFSGPPPKPEGAKGVQEVMFSTTRLVFNDGDFCEQSIADQRCPNQTQTYGRAWVSIPEGHKIGNVETPRFEWSTLSTQEERDHQHFRLLDVSDVRDKAFFGEIQTSSNESVLLFVHGYNTSFRDAVFTAAQIAFDANFDGKVIVYSWPSKASISSYDYDRESALLSRAPLLTLLHELGSSKNLFLVAHSLGSLIVIEALQMASLKQTNLNVREVVFAAPDVDKDVFTSCAALIKQAAGGITLYASSADKALLVSKAKAGGVPRAGDMPESGPLLIDGIDLIDVTVLGEDMFGLNHGVFARSRSVLDDLGRIVSSGIRPPHVRTPTLRRMPDRASTKYWAYPP
jgi:esterase/lipase superfamily enzyme